MNDKKKLEAKCYNLETEVFILKGGIHKREHNILAKAGYFRLICEKHGKCNRCGSKTDLTAHHKKPRSKGGLNKEDNIEVLCNKCHKAIDHDKL